MPMSNGQYPPEIYKKALDNLLRRKGYHEATPVQKQEMLAKECERLTREREQ